jgi:hypothetical protein
MAKIAVHSMEPGCTKDIKQTANFHVLGVKMSFPVIIQVFKTPRTLFN